MIQHVQNYYQKTDRQHKTKAQPAVGMHGFGHDKGHKVFTWSHDSRDQSWVAQNTRREARGAVATQEPGPPQLRFGGLRHKLEKEGPKRPRQWTAKT